MALQFISWKGHLEESGSGRSTFVAVEFEHIALRSWGELLVLRGEVFLHPTSVFSIYPGNPGMVCEISRDELMTILREHPRDKDLLNPHLALNFSHFDRPVSVGWGGSRVYDMGKSFHKVLGNKQLEGENIQHSADSFSPSCHTKYWTAMKGNMDPGSKAYVIRVRLHIGT